MKSLKQLCVPRPSVFDTQRRDTVLDISDLLGDRIEPDEFFRENYITEGMKTLLEQGFRRLEGKSSQGIFKLKQAMGGGKTHNLLVLGLLAKHPEVRRQVMGRFYTPDPNLAPVKVVAFSGRESDAPFGLWGAIAEQLGKKEHFKDLYSPLQAPGQTAWETLLAGETVLIMLDELAPYFESARSKAIGNSDLAQVTATALSNLMVAIGREGCNRVCLVLTELVGSYEHGTGQISSVIADLEKETHRSAMALEPVRMNSDELYHILRARIFQEVPPEAEVREVAHAYAGAIRDAKQMDITSESPEQFSARIQVSYPFHPAIRDLYARFRENPGFQQTRGLIRIMRIVVSRLWNTGMADKRFLIAAHDLDLNDRETLGEIAQINSSLGNAIAHDIASGGQAIAEVMDANLGGTDARDACRLLFISSLANVPNAILGLSIPELAANLAEPGRDLTRLKNDVLAKLATAAWYLHSTRDGKLFFRNVENLNAKLESLVQAYNSDQALKEIRTRLEDLFKPTNSFCYQRVLALPAVDEIELDQDRVTLVVTEPQSGHGLRRELMDFYGQATYKNRVGFLTGPRNTYDQLIDTGKRLKAIQSILGDLATDKVADNDPQMVQAKDLRERILLGFHSAVRETFTTLWYPFGSSLVSSDFSMQFSSNKYDGEQQILQLLKEKAKFEEDVSSDIFRKKCEQRLFTTQSLPWSEIKLRAATNPKWQWHHPQALEGLKADCLRKDIWREQGGYVDKGPFPAPKTDVLIQEQIRNDDTGEVTLRVTPVDADTVYYDVGSAATTASAKVDAATLKTREMKVSFLAVDSKGEHQAGEPRLWQNRVTLKHRTYQSGADKRLELRCAPSGTIYYTTDGSDPKLAGAVYDEPFVVPKSATLVLACAECDGVRSDVERIPIDWSESGTVQVDPKRPAVWRPRQGFGFNSTRDSYDFLSRLTKHDALVSGVSIIISGEGGDKGWVELQMYEGKRAGAGPVGRLPGVLAQAADDGPGAVGRHDALLRPGAGPSGLGRRDENHPQTGRGQTVTSTARSEPNRQDSFGFDPEESAHHFLVNVPQDALGKVEISEHVTWDAEIGSSKVHSGPDADGQIRVVLARPKWDAIADEVRACFNRRLKQMGRRSGTWRTGKNLVRRELGKELVLLAWAIEDADPGLIPTAVANWNGLEPEERWWLYTQTAAATGHGINDRRVGWRKAVRFALTENPVHDRLSSEAGTPEFFRRAAAGPLFQIDSANQDEDEEKS